MAIDVNPACLAKVELPSETPECAGAFIDARREAAVALNLGRPQVCRNVAIMVAKYSGYGWRYSDNV